MDRAANRTILLSGIIVVLNWYAVLSHDLTPDWPMLIGCSLVTGFLVLVFPANRHHHIPAGAVHLSALMAAAAAATSLHAAPLSWPVVGAPLGLGLAALALAVYAGVCLIATGMFMDWRDRQRSMRKPPLMPGGMAHQPFVSVHVPLHRAPMEHVRDTLESLAQLHWRHYEVLVIEQGGKPGEHAAIAELCARLGPRFRFLQAEHAGARGAALNRARKACDPETEIIAVVHAGTRVNPRMLHDLVSQFQAKGVGIVHAGLSFRDGGKSLFKAICEADYRSLLFAGMRRCDRADAIIHHAKLALVRRETLDRLGGWDEQAWLEDAALDLLAVEHGYEIVYLATPYGSTLLPERFADYRQQRFRWILGAIDLFRRHAATLTVGMRARLLGSLLPWMNDGLIVALSIAGILWSLALASFPEGLAPPPLALTALLMLPVLLKMARSMHHMRSRVEASFRQSLAATLADLAMTQVGAMALIASSRTCPSPGASPDVHGPAEKLERNLLLAGREILLMLLLILCITLLTLHAPMQDWRWVGWLVLLGLLCLPYGCMLLMAIAAGLPFLPASWVRNGIS